MLPRLLRYCSILLFVLFLATRPSMVVAAPPHAFILPDSTRGHMASLDLDQLENQWNKTQIGRLMADPVMQPFKEDLRRQFNEKLEQATEQLGLTWDDVRAMAGGEVSASVIRQDGGATVLAVLIDVTGKTEEAQSRLEVIYKRLTDAKATRRRAERIGDTDLTIFDLAPRPGIANDRRQSAFFLKDNLLAAVADVPTAREMVHRFSGEATDNLAHRPAYQSIFDRCRIDAGDVEPDIHWFVEPMAYVEAMRAADPDYKREGKDMLKVLKNQGFEGVGGLGGFVNFSADGGRYEMLHRTSIFAPRPFQLAMRMMEFPNSDQFAPYDWVPRDVATYASFYNDLQNSFERVSTLFDELFGEGQEGMFEETLESVRTDPFGPRLDIRNDVIAYLGSRVTVITDYQLPITTTSERTVWAIEARDEEKLAKSIKRWLDADRSAKQIEFEGHAVWEVSEENEDVIEVKIEHKIPDIRGRKPKRKKLIERDEEQPLFSSSSSAVAVAHGHLLVATHLDILKKVLREKGARQRLINDFDYQVVNDELSRLAPDLNCARIFSRTEEEYRPAYELLRTGKLPEAETTLAKVINAVLGTKKGEVRKPKIDGSKLPEFETIRRYFGPAGLVITTEDDGWFAVGVTLNKETP